MKSILAAAVLALGVGALLPASADAAVLGQQAIAPAQHVGNGLIEVQHHGYRHDRRYDRHRHGDRYRHRRHGYNHFYGGYYYASPWWLGAAIYAPRPQPYYAPPPPPVYGGYGGGGGHVDYCLSRYRSYDPRSDTYLGYDGYRHRCVSPY